MYMNQLKGKTEKPLNTRRKRKVQKCLRSGDDNVTRRLHSNENVVRDTEHTQKTRKIK